MGMGEHQEEFRGSGGRTQYCKTEKQGYWNAQERTGVTAEKNRG